MKYLLDSCTMIWHTFNAKKKMSESTFKIIEHPESEIFISMATFGELAIKESLGKANFPIKINLELVNFLKNQNFIILDISLAHAIEVKNLPWVHRDPFDRLLISQCKIEKLTAITPDPRWAHKDYGIKVKWELI